MTKELKRYEQLETKWDEWFYNYGYGSYPSYLETINTSDLILYQRYDPNYNIVNELKSRNDIPDELKLQILLMEDIIDD